MDAARTWANNQEGLCVWELIRVPADNLQGTTEDGQITLPRQDYKVLQRNSKWYTCN